MYSSIYVYIVFYVLSTKMNLLCLKESMSSLRVMVTILNENANSAGWDHTMTA